MIEMYRTNIYPEDFTKGERNDGFVVVSHIPQTELIFLVLFL